MDSNILNQYTERIYGYAVKKVYSREEADELSQEILFTAIKQLPTLKSEKSFEPWLWGVANNVTKVYRRQKGRERERYVYDSVDTSSYYDEYSFEKTALHDQIRKQIAMLSALYRDIVILHYYDNLSCKEIAKKLKVPEGTVTWRLSEGRKKLKKGCINMTETALRPVKLSISMNGSGNYNGEDIPFPWVFINDALSQNILYHSYRIAQTVEDLAKLCGVPAYYIENSLENLLAREAIVEIVKGKYQTNFIIYGQEMRQHYEEVKRFGENIAETVINTLKVFTSEVMQMDIYTGGKTEEELRYLFGTLAFEHLNPLYNPVPYVAYPIRYDGNGWSYHAYIEGAPSRGFGIGMNKNMNEGGVGSLVHYVYHFAGFVDRRMMGMNEINLCEEILTHKPTELLEDRDKEKLAYLIREGYIKKGDEQKLEVAIPYLTLEQKKQFDCLAEKCFGPIMDQIVDAVERYVVGYKKLFPKHLKDDVQRTCNYLFMGLLANVIGYAQEQGWIQRPKEGSVCDILIQFK